ncbi:MAG: hypothetical protein ACE5GL_01395 [Calditrichia bacterium]
MRNRVFIFAVILFSTVALWQCAPERTEKLSSDVAIQLSMLPEEANGVTYINVAALKESPFFAMAMEDLDRNHFTHSEYEEFMEATGFDLRKDVEKIYIAFSPGDNPHAKKFIAVVTGKFNPEKIMEFASRKDEEHKIVAEDHANFKIYRMEDKPFSLSFPDDRTLLLGADEMVNDWLDRFKETSGKRVLSKKWINKIEKMTYKNGMCFTMDTEPVINTFMQQINRYGEGLRLEALKSLQEIDFSMALDDKIRFDGVGQFSDAENAGLFHDAFKGIIATAKISVSGERDMVDMINQLKVKKQGKDVSVKFELSQEDIQKFKSKQHKFDVI